MLLFKFFFFFFFSLFYLYCSWVTDAHFPLTGNMLLNQFVQTASYKITHQALEVNGSGKMEAQNLVQKPNRTHSLVKRSSLILSKRLKIWVNGKEPFLMDEKYRL